MLVDTVEFDPAPAPPVVGLGGFVPETASAVLVAVAMEPGDCPELADVADVDTALDPPDLVGTGLEVTFDEDVLDSEADVVEEPPILLLSTPEDVAVLDTEEAEDSSVEDEPRVMTDPLAVLVCWDVVCSAAEEVTSACAEVDVAEVASVASQ